MRAALLLAALALTAAVGAGAQPVADAEAAAATVMRQLEAFRRDDFDAAYGYASREIRSVFDRQGFERMVRDGYPEIARSRSASIEESTAGPDGRVYLRVRVWGANGRAVDATYELVYEDGGWRINGVVARPNNMGAQKWPPCPQRSERPGHAVALL